jgi:hypothetical protein
MVEVDGRGALGGGVGALVGVGMVDRFGGAGLGVVDRHYGSCVPDSSALWPLWTLTCDAPSPPGVVACSPLAFLSTSI